MAGAKIIKLEYPIGIPKEDGSKTYVNELSIGRFKLKHIKKLPPEVFNTEGKVNANELIPIMSSLIASLAGIPEESADDIDFADLESVMEVLGDFFEGTRAKTGEKLSG